MKRLPVISILVLATALVSVADAEMTFNLKGPGSAISFQNEGTLEADHTAELKYGDCKWAPGSPTGTVEFDYYATGTANRWWDAVSLNFDLSDLGYSNIKTAKLRFYAQKGDYWRNNWHHYQILPGAKNTTNQDYGFAEQGPDPSAGLTSFGSDDSIFKGWLEADVPLAWINSDSFDITLRMWNARLDQVQLVANPVPVPGSLLLCGIGIACGSYVRRRRG